MVTRKVAPALAAGCTVVLKPAEQTPLTATGPHGASSPEAGVPPGVLQPGDHQRPRGGRPMRGCRTHRVAQDYVYRLHRSGQALMRKAADQVKRVSLELGGHTPVIVFDDADVDKAVAGPWPPNSQLPARRASAPTAFTCRKASTSGFAEKFDRSGAKPAGRRRFERRRRGGPAGGRGRPGEGNGHVEDAVAGGAGLLAGGHA